MTEQKKKTICSCCGEECGDNPIILEWMGGKLIFCDMLCVEETAELLNAYYDEEQGKLLPKIIEAGAIPLRSIHDLDAIADDVKKWLGKRSADFLFVFECKVEGRDWRAEY